MAGRFLGSGAVMKFWKETGETDGFIHFGQMTSVRGFTAMEGDFITVCGDYLADGVNDSPLETARYTSVIAQMYI